MMMQEFPGTIPRHGNGRRDDPPATSASSILQFAEEFPISFAKSDTNSHLDRAVTRMRPSLTEFQDFAHSALRDQISSQ
jgi:hypothetical protein